MRLHLYSALALATALAWTAAALPKVSRTGRYLYTEDGTRFFIKGIAYQTQGQIVPGPDNPLNQPSTFVDNLADGNACARDLPYLQQLGVNAIRAYSANSSLNHDDCMHAFSAAGIYVILDLTLPLNGSIVTTQPSWSTNLLDQFLRTIDTFEQYDNVLAYNVGNEVMTSTTSEAAPFIMAAARDVKAYLNSIQSSALVGYAAINGNDTFVDNNAQFLACDHPDGDGGAIDLYGLNDYQWCGNASSDTFDSLNQRFANYPVAAYFSEFGGENCNPGVRVWTEVPVMFSAPMTNVWSGGAAFGYFSAMSQGHQFGMATLSSDNTSITTDADFTNLVSEYTALGTNFPTTPPQSAQPKTDNLPSCPTGWGITASGALPPTPDDAACGCLADGLLCQFVPPTPDYTVVMGDLFGVACGLLANLGDTQSCLDVSADGVSGVYGRVAMCDPTIRLSYVMSQYYELEHGAEGACSFLGNATVNYSGKAGTGGLASKCIPSASVFTPSAPPVLLPVSATASGSSTAGTKGASINGAEAKTIWVGAAACILGTFVGAVMVY
ncbi:1,3-beta-glucanosyltransferase [Mycena chlorophos]|uniref:1,3-beta-glucanosyltransferase n=1 Tax=Mycena chlorophos TaxID=658473 RepID=A0A8H6SIW2_MYCCL|nr:1,3-beta-glucanosyltransferase [Mycena chlorophos]